MAAALVFLFTTAAVFFLAFLALDVLHKAFEQYKLRYVTKSMNDLSDMFLFIEPGQILLLNVASLPLFIGLFFNFYRPDLMEPMFEKAYGYVLVSVIIMLEAAGFVVIRKIVNIDV